MSLTAAQRAEVSRQNGCKSNGPKSDRGKSRSRSNALKHGLRAETLALPNEDPAAVAARSDAWNDHYQPQSPAAQHLVNACVAATLLADRCNRYHEAALAKQVRDADHAWEVEREEAVAALVVLLRTDPATAARGLARTGHGCRYLIERWEWLLVALSEDGRWLGPEGDEALHLLGYRPQGVHLKECPDAWETRLLALACHPDPPEDTVAWFFLPNHFPELYFHIYSPDELPSPDECREKLRALVEAQLARARALEDFHREVRDDPDRAEAADRALILHDGLPARLFLRYHAEARTSFQRSYGSLVKALELDASADSPNEPTADPADPAGAVSPNEPGSDTNPPEVATSDPPAGVESDPAAPAHAAGTPPRRSRKAVPDSERVGPILIRLLAEAEAGADQAPGACHSQDPRFEGDTPPAL